MEDLVFITGGSGHIGSRVIVDTLEAGYSVRAAVRSESKKEKILAMPSMIALSPGNRLEFVIVPDFSVGGAYDDVVKGATYVIHIASPLPSQGCESYQTTLIEPAVKATLNILEAAKMARTIQRVVITSSAIALLSWEEFTSGSATEFNEKSRTSLPPQPYSNVFEAYSDSKIAALNETERWLARERTSISFDIISLFPSFVIGRNELVTDKADAFRGANEVVLRPLTGTVMNYTPGVSVHIQDVALAHVRSLNANVPGNQGYLLTSGGLGGTRWETAVDFAACHFPDAFLTGTLSKNGRIRTVPLKMDASASEKALKLQYHSFEKQVQDAVQHYLELLALR
jgi:nucleoside-diphosphate-sugar epimerase